VLPSTIGAVHSDPPVRRVLWTRHPRRAAAHRCCCPPSANVAACSKEMCAVPLRWRYISKKWPQSGGRRRWSALGQSIPTTTRPCNLWRLAAHQGFYKLHSRACQRGQILVLLHHCSLPLYGGGYNSESCVSIPCHLPLHPVRSPPRQHGYRRLNPSCAFCRSGSTPQVVKYSNHKDMHAHHALRVCVVTDRVMHCMASVCMLW